MNILIDAAPLAAPFNGTWRFTIELIKGLNTSGHHVTVALPGVSTVPDELGQLPVTQLSIPMGTASPSAFDRIRWEVITIPKISKRFDLTIVPYFSWSGIRGKRFVAICVLDLWAFQSEASRGRPKIKHLMRRALLKWSLLRAWNVITISDFVRKEIHEKFGRHADVVLLGVNTPTLSMAKMLERSRAPYVLYVGGYGERKQVEFLIKSLETVRHGLPRDWRLVLVGNPPPKILSACSRFAEHVEIWPHVTDKQLDKLYEEAKIFVYPSIYEGFGLPPLEAMVHGTPVIVRPYASLPEIVDKAGIVLSEDKPKEMGDVIVRLLMDHDMWRKYQQKALARSQELNWNETHKRIDTVIRKWVTSERKR